MSRDFNHTLILKRSGLGLLMGKFCQVLTDLSARQGIIVLPFLLPQKTGVRWASLNVKCECDWIHLVDFLPFMFRETTFVTSCLLSYTLIPFLKEVYCKKKEFAEGDKKKMTEFPPMKVYLFSLRCLNSWCNNIIIRCFHCQNKQI